MDIFGGKCLADILHFYDVRGNKTMIKKIHELLVEITEDLEPNYKQVEMESETDEEYEVENEIIEYVKDENGFFSLK